MQVDIVDQPSFAHLQVHLDPGDSIVAESDAMASRSSNLKMQTRLNGGFVKGMLRKFLGGESLFINEFSCPARSQGGDLVITQRTPGDIRKIDLQGDSLFLQPGAFIACEPSVHLGLGYAGLASFIGREGLFRLRVSGQGAVWFGAYGAIFVREIDDEFVVDSGHLVAYEPTISLRMGMAGGLVSSVFSKEGLVTRLRGPGLAYLQSRRMGGLASWTNARIW
jgi:uncharacterized protein (TIGR00266 family)